MPEIPPHRGERNPLMWGVIPHDRGEISKVMLKTTNYGSTSH